MASGIGDGGWFEEVVGTKLDGVFAVCVGSVVSSSILTAAETLV